MKTLAQIEPRTAISSLPFTITNSGSYYLAASLSGSSGQSGITVQADNVTLDLNGFALESLASIQRTASVLTKLVEYQLLSAVVGWKTR
jgi:hypothetical protein